MNSDLVFDRLAAATAIIVDDLRDAGLEHMIGDEFGFAVRRLSDGREDGSASRFEAAFDIVTPGGLTFQLAEVFSISSDGDGLTSEGLAASVVEAVRVIAERSEEIQRRHDALRSKADDLMKMARDRGMPMALVGIVPDRVVLTDVSGGPGDRFVVTMTMLDYRDQPSLHTMKTTDADDFDTYFGAEILPEQFGRSGGSGVVAAAATTH